MITACSPLKPQGTVAPVEVPNTFKASPNAVVPAESSTPSSDWWTAYDDPTLNALIAKANLNNTDLQSAAARMAHAKAAARQTTALQSPAMALNAGASRQQGTLVNAAGTQGNLATAGVSVSYEVDVWGRIAKSSNAAQIDVRAQESLRQSVQLLVQAQVAQTYLALRALDEDAALLDQTYQLRQEVMRIHEQRHELGSLSASQLAAHRQEVDTLRMDMLRVRRERSDMENALATLQGESPSTFHLPQTPWAATLPTVRPGLPAAVLARRPDIASAQQTVLATQQRMEATQTAWLPNLSLTGAGGFASPDLKDLFNTSMQSLMFGVLTSLPLFDGGRREANVAMADADRTAALVNYREQVLQALREVEDSLNNAQSLQDQHVLMTASLQLASQRVEMADSMYRNGLVSKLDTLDKHAQALQTRRLQMKVRASQYQATVSLIRALGGTWH